MYAALEEWEFVRGAVSNKQAKILIKETYRNYVFSFFLLPITDDNKPSLMSDRPLKLSRACFSCKR